MKKLIFILSISFFWSCTGNKKSGQEPFDTDKWINGTQAQRGAMYDFLIDSIGLIDKQEEEILVLLGSPDENIPVEDIDDYQRIFKYYVDKGDMYVYDLMLFSDKDNTVVATLLDD